MLLNACSRPAINFFPNILTKHFMDLALLNGENDNSGNYFRVLNIDNVKELLF